MVKNILKIFCILLCSTYLNASIQSFTLDNDVFIDGKDAHYTNGIFYTWMDEEENSLGKEFLKHLKTNNAISFSHLIFTPEKKEVKEPIFSDLPYAGYAKLDYFLYKSSKNSFHEFGINLGLVGPSTQAKNIQNSYHNINGATKAQGWDNQLKDKLMGGISYNFAKKSDTMKLSSYDFDWTNNIRANLDSFYSGILASTTFRISNDMPETFATSGNFIGGNESDLLNFKSKENFDWTLSLSLFANKVFNYYIVDEGIDLGYDILELDYILGQQLVFDIFYKEIQYRLKIKSTVLYDNKDEHASKNWGGINIIWKF